MSRENLGRLLGAVALATAVIALWMLGGWQRPLPCPGENPLVSLNVGQVALSVEIAADDSARQCGLANRDHLPDDRGMLFAYADEQVLEFWMQDTHIPLTIAFIGKDYRIREIVDMQPGSPEHVYRSADKVKYALETNQGWFEANGVATGDRVRFSLPADLQIR